MTANGATISVAIPLMAAINPIIRPEAPRSARVTLRRGSAILKPTALMALQKSLRQRYNGVLIGCEHPGPLRRDLIKSWRVVRSLPP